jgi:DNA repair ATPase RecN
MIIVKTTNGDCFINEVETLQVNHIRDNALVEVWPSRWCNQQLQSQYYIIENVESVIYTTQETKWKDEGSELETLKKRFREINQLVDKYRKKETENILLEDKIARLQEKLRDFGCEL